MSRAFASFPQLQRDVGPVHIDQVLVVHLQHQGGYLGEPAGKQVLDKVSCEQVLFVHLQNFIVCHGQKFIVLLVFLPVKPFFNIYKSIYNSGKDDNPVAMHGTA